VATAAAFKPQLRAAIQICNGPIMCEAIRTQMRNARRIQKEFHHHEAVHFMNLNHERTMVAHGMFACILAGAEVLAVCGNRV
jgi:hypothetical protein